MSEASRPENAAQVEDAVKSALSAGMPLEILGRGTKRGLGRPMQTAARLDLSALRGITLYEPEELVMSALAGTPISEIEAALAEKRQQLAFEPADYGPLYGAEANAGTIGGVFACNLSGPRRFKAGAARDHLLGVKAVSGRGESFKTGGRVVKNVTGYDLCKLLAGSYGTLAAMTEVTFKVLPAGEKTRTVLLFGLSDRIAVEVMGAAASTPHEVSGIAHVPHPITRRIGVNIIARAGAGVTALRVEGPAPSVAARLYGLTMEFGKRAAFDEITGHASGVFWRQIRDANVFAAEKHRPLWRLSVPPATAAAVIERIRERLGAGIEWYYDAAGGLIWLSVLGEASAEAVRASLVPGGGHATLIRAADAVRAAQPVFHPQDEALAALTRRIKTGFDPQSLLNPGRMYPGA
ncbi:MAG TPA: glycolate oxidase subunit GlcE [Candidatus Cybelea sp.]|nr:glycolate oxidase subunit GlcE [Candidatus Cybelea sp.]